MLESSPVDAQPRQFSINVLSNVAVMLLNIGIGLWFTPYLINNLGIALYGLVTLAISVTNYMFIINTALDTSVGRFLTLDIRQQDFHKANQTFNTAFWVTSAVCFVLLPILGGLSYLSPSLFNVPSGEERATQLLFATVMLAFLFVFFRSIFTTSPFAYNRLDLRNFIIASNILFRIGFVVAAFSLVLVPKIWHVGLAILGASFCSLVFSIFIWHKLTPALYIHLNSFRKSRLRQMFSMSGWLMINQIGTLLFLNIDLIVINLALGVEVQGGYASVLQIAILLRTFAAVISTAITPLAISQYAQEKYDSLVKMTHLAIKWMGLLLALPIGGIVGFSSVFLALWLGSDFKYLSPLLVLMSIHLCINLAVLPLFSVQIAMNKVRLPGMTTLALGLINLFLAIWWVQFDYHGLGVALAGAVVLTAKNAFFTPIYGAYIQNIPWHSFLLDMIPGVLGTVCVALVSWVISVGFMIDSYAALFGSGLGVSIVYLAVIFLLASDAKERKLILSHFGRRF